MEHNSSMSGVALSKLTKLTKPEEQRAKPSKLTKLTKPAEQLRKLVLQQCCNRAVCGRSDASPHASGVLQQSCNRAATELYAVAVTQARMHQGCCMGCGSSGD